MPQSAPVEVVSRPSGVAPLDFYQAVWPVSSLESVLGLPPMSAPSTGNTDTCYHVQLFVGPVGPHPAPPTFVHQVLLPLTHLPTPSHLHYPDHCLSCLPSLET